MRNRPAAEPRVRPERACTLASLLATLESWLVEGAPSAFVAAYAIAPENAGARGTGGESIPRVRRRLQREAHPGEAVAIGAGDAVVLAFRASDENAVGRRVARLRASLEREGLPPDDLVIAGAAPSDGARSLLERALAEARVSACAR